MDCPNPYFELNIYIAILDWTDVRVARSLRSLANKAKLFGPKDSYSIETVLYIQTTYSQLINGWPL